MRDRLVAMTLVVTVATVSYSADAAPAKKLVVAASGGDFTKIQGAIDSLGTVGSDNGSVIEVMPGVYEENITLKHGIKLVGHQAVIAPLDDTKPAVLLKEVNNVVIEGFVIHGRQPTDPPKGAIGAGSGIFIVDSSGVRVRDNEVVGASAAIVVNACRFVTVESNWIVDAVHGVKVSSGGTLAHTYVFVRDNVIRQARHGISADADVVVEGNEIHAEGVPNARVGISVGRPVAQVVRGNRIKGGYEDGILSAGTVPANLADAPRVLITQNIVDGANDAIDVAGTPVHVIANALFGEKSGLRITKLPGGYTAETSPVPRVNYNWISSLILDGDLAGRVPEALNTTTNDAFAPQLAEYTLTVTTTTEKSVATKRHTFCGLTKVKFQPKGTGTNRWCELTRNSDNTWTLQARSATDAETQCKAQCF